LKSTNSPESKKSNLEYITKLVEGMETAAKHPKFNAPSILFSNLLGLIVQANKKKGGDDETKAIAAKIRSLIMLGLVRIDLGPEEFKAALSCMSQEATELSVCSEVYRSSLIFRLQNLL
jgi:hypothetical protein